MEFLELFWRGIRGLIRRPRPEDSERELAKDAIGAVVVVVVVGLFLVAMFAAIVA